MGKPMRLAVAMRPALARRAVITFVAALAAAFALQAEPSRAQNLPLAPESLAGVWSGQEASPIGIMRVDVIFFPNGTYTRSHTGGALMTRDVGRYTIVQNWIHFQLDDYNPKQYKGRVLTWPTSDTWVVSRFDGHFIQATVGGNSLVTVQRQR